MADNGINLWPLTDLIADRFKLDPNGIHGGKHWGRVWRNGLRLAQVTGADIEVIRLFALIHDSCRDDENADPLHGMRAAVFATHLRHTKALELSNEQFDQLHFAIGAHSDGLTEGPVTVQACWDADRLDLGRVGVRPDPARLCTAAARDPKMISFAFKQSRRT